MKSAIPSTNVGIRTLVTGEGSHILVQPGMRCDLEPVIVSVFDVASHGIVVDAIPLPIEVKKRLLA